VEELCRLQIIGRHDKLLKMILCFCLICNLPTVIIWFVMIILFNRLMPLWFDSKERVW